MEPFENIGFVCEAHTPKPNPVYFNMPFSWFFKKHCKLGFPTGLVQGPHFEFMFVRVTHQEEIGGRKMLVGKLDNDPVYVREYRCNDGVAFDRTEICSVYEDNIITN